MKETGFWLFGRKRVSKISALSHFDLNGSTYILSVCEDSVLKVWSYQTVSSSVEVGISGWGTTGLTQVRHKLHVFTSPSHHCPRIAVMTTDGSYSQIKVFEPTELAGVVELKCINVSFMMGRIVDMKLTEKSLWAINDSAANQRYGGGPFSLCHLDLHKESDLSTTLENNSWQFTQLTPLSHELSEVIHSEDISDAEEYFTDKIFASGSTTFSITTIKDALSKYVEPAVLDLRHFSVSQLKMKVIGEINRKASELVIIDDNYETSPLHLYNEWNHFYKLCLTHLTEDWKPLALLVHPEWQWVSVLRRDMQSVVIPMSPLERIDSTILLADETSESTEIFLSDTLVGKAPLERDTYLLFNCLNLIGSHMPAKLVNEFEDNLNHLRTPEASAPLISSLVGRFESRSAMRNNVRTEFWKYFGKIKQPARAISAILDLLHSNSNASAGGSAIKNQDISIATSLVVSAASTKIERRFEIARNLLFTLFLLERLQNKTTQGELYPNLLSVVPRLFSLVRALYALKALFQGNKATNSRSPLQAYLKSVTNELSSSAYFVENYREYASSSSPIPLDGYAALFSEAFVHLLLNEATQFCPTSSLSAFLSSSPNYFPLLKSYLRLLEKKRASDLYLLGECHIRSGSASASSLHKAKAYFLQAGQAILEGDKSFSIHQSQAPHSDTPFSREENFVHFSFNVIDVWDKAQKPQHVIDQALLTLRRISHTQSSAEEDSRDDDDERMEEEEDSDSQEVGSKRKRGAQSTPRRTATKNARAAKVDELRHIVFKASLKVPDYYQAYAALVSITNEVKRKDCLEHLVSVAYKRRALDTLVNLPFHLPGIKDKVKAILLKNARKEFSFSSGSPSFYHVLYAFNMHYTDYRGASEAMYELAARLIHADCNIVIKEETEDVEMEEAFGRQEGEEREVIELLKIREESLLASLNALSLSHHQYFLLDNPPTPESEDTKGSQQCLEESVPKVISKKGLERELLLTQAHIRLFNSGSSSLLPSRSQISVSLFDARVTLPFLFSVGEWEMAFSLASLFKLDMSPIFTTYTFNLLNLYALPTDVAEKLLHKSFASFLSVMPAAYHGTSALSALWRMLVFFLAKYETSETNGNYHKAVIENILSFSFSYLTKSVSPDAGDAILTSFLETKSSTRIPVWLTEPFWSPQSDDREELEAELASLTFTTPINASVTSKDPATLLRIYLSCNLLEEARAIVLDILNDEEKLQTYSAPQLIDQLLLQLRDWPDGEEEATEIKDKLDTLFPGRH
eukprot:TRINITY_DN6491_c0_g1_i1.p1 TRINITY_DN6491_c0_g1~~TRINITY_DN6491_c0_g1_i1.p1  ORF type:complete len:1438 (+),score=359.36 TRINITY_DN6491_c0_g1_i1:532-4314(+)